MSINRFPFQDDIVRQLAKGAATAAAVSNTIASEGRAPGHGENSSELHREVAENIDHLVNLGRGGSRNGCRHPPPVFTDPPYFPPPAARCTADLIAPVMMLPRP